MVPPPSDIYDARYLSSRDPWLQLACIFERAKRGDFSAAMLLPEIWQDATDEVAYNAQTLFAYIANGDALAMLDAQITDPDTPYRSECADAAALSGSLRFVGVFVAGHRVAFGETTRMAMEEGIHNLLCEDPDVDTTTPLLSAGAEGERVLATRAAQKAQRFGSQTSLFNGAPLHARDLVTSVWEAVEAGEGTSIEVALSRLQAMLGFSQAGLFANERSIAKVPAIRATLEQFDYDSMTAGVRYFFGYPVPF